MVMDEYTPQEFKDKYPSTHVIIDATEFPIEKPANPDTQAAAWSNYRNRNTLKLPVGVTPNGIISFLSLLYGGRISDKEITRRSGVLSLLERGDSVMADRGFDIDSFMPDGTLVNIALVRKTRVPGFDTQLRCLNFSFLRPSVSAFFRRLVCWNGLIEGD